MVGVALSKITHLQQGGVWLGIRSEENVVEEIEEVTRGLGETL